MTGCTVCSFRKRSGSFALEAALTVPVLLAILLFLVSMLLSVQAELRLKTAVDRTAAEIALLPPVIFTLIDESAMKLPIADLLTGKVADAVDGASGADGAAGDDGSDAGAAQLAGQLRAGILDIVKPDKLEALVNDAALDLTSSVLLSTLVNARIEHWRGRLGPSRLLGPPSAWLDWNLADDQLYLEIDYEVRTLLGRTRRQVTALVPVWRPQQPDAETPGDGDSIWKLDNFTRGRKLRSKFGGNLPSSYPVIARFEGGEALAIKSMDLTKPTYSDPQAVFKRVSEQIDALAAFSGTPKPFGKEAIWIQPAQIQSRRLLLVVPADGRLDRYSAVFAGLTREAAARGVTFEIVTHGLAIGSPAAAKPG